MSGKLKDAQPGSSSISKLPIRHAIIASLLFFYFMAMFYLVPSFAPAMLEPSIANQVKYFVITYGLATFCTYFSRAFYVTDISFRFELVAGLVVALVFFVVIGPPQLQLRQTSTAPPGVTVLR